MSMRNATSTQTPTIRPPEPQWLVLGELAIIPLYFVAMIAVWGLVLGAVPWWMWAGLGMYGGGGAWAAGREARGGRASTRRDVMESDSR